MRTPFHSAISLLVFLLTIIGTYALAPGSLKLRIPKTGWNVPLHFCWIPWFSVIILLLVQAITPKDIGTALVGDQTVRPATVIVTYLSLAYLAVSCEITGLFGWLALHIARRTRGRPLLLLCAFFGLSGAVSAATSADVSLVTLTPIMVYTAAAANWDPMALATTHMAAASVSSMLVSVSGVQNIVIAQACGLGFTRFLTWMVLPTAAAVGVIFGLTYLLLLHRRRKAPGRSDQGPGLLPFPDPAILLHDQVGASFSAATLMGCLLALAVAPSLRWSGWLVAAVFATLAGLYNLMALLGPLKGTIGRRSAYERRKRLHAELAQQGLHRVVSDEDLADLLLSAAQHREASFTRLAAATACRVGGPAAAAAATAGRGGPGSTVPPPYGHSRLPHTHSGIAASSRHHSAGSGPGGMAQARMSYNGGGGGAAAGSSNHSLASLPSAVGSTSGGAGGFGSGSAGSPVRHWFSQRWSSLRGWTGSVPLNTDLVEAAADAGANLSILGEGSVAAAAAAAAAAGAGASSSSTPRGKPGAAGSITAAAAATAAALVSAPRMSVELQQLLTHGTATAPDAPEWWAAAAHSAQELAQSHGEGADTARTGTFAATGYSALTSVPYSPCMSPYMCHGPITRPAAAMAAEPRAACGAAGMLAAAAAAGCNAAAGVSSGRTGCSAGRPHGGSALTAESAFADADAMRVPGWDGRLASASACRPPQLTPSAPGAASPAAAELARSGSGREPEQDAVGLKGWAVGVPERPPGDVEWTGAGRAAEVTAAVTSSEEASASSALLADQQMPLLTQPLPPQRHPPSQRYHQQQHQQHYPDAARHTASSPGLDSQRPSGDINVFASAKHRVFNGVGSGGTAATEAPSLSLGDPRDTCLNDSGSGAATGSGGSRGKSGSFHGSPVTSGCARRVAADTAGGHGCAAAAAAAAASFHDPTHVPDQRRAPPGPARTFVRRRSASAVPLLRSYDTAGAPSPSLNPSLSGCWSSRSDSPTEPLLLLQPPARTLGRESGEGEDAGLDNSGADGEGDHEGDNDDDAAPLLRRRTLPSTSGFEGLFGCWRPEVRDVESESESAALLAPGRLGDASDDPRHTLSRALPPPQPLPVLSCQQPRPQQQQQPVVFRAAAPGGVTSQVPHLAAASSCTASDAQLKGAIRGETLQSRSPQGPGGCGPPSPLKATAATLYGAADSSAGCGHVRSPFAVAATADGVELAPLRLSNGGGAGPGDGGTGSRCGFGGGSSHGGGSGGGGGLYHFESLGGLSSIVGWQNQQQRMRPPSLGLLLFGSSNEVSFLGTFLALPWANAVLLLGMFVMVEALQVHGWVGSLASLLSTMIQPTAAAPPSTSITHSSPPSPATTTSNMPSIASAVFAVGWLSAGLAVGMTGQSATLLLTQALRQPEFLPALPGGGAAVRRGAHLALLVAANLAPALSLSGSLTALRWGLGLWHLGVRLRCGRYMVTGLLPAAMAAMAAALLVLWGQSVAWG